MKLTSSVVGRVVVNLGIAAGLLASAASHAYLYVHGYQHIPVVGPGFLILASVFGSLAVLIAVGGPAWLRVAALFGALGAIGAFALSRTTGLFGFVELGLHPAPHALISLVSEVVVVILAGWSLRDLIVIPAVHPFRQKVR
jgi:hypothetical protein